jgi:hypothetical protein
MGFNCNTFSKFFHKAIKVFLFLFLFSSTSFGQGILRGVVLDSANAEPLVGANIIVVGTSLGDATDLEGKFRISGIPKNKKSIRISYMGYNAKTLQIDLTKKEEYLTIKLKPDYVSIGEVTVTAQYKGQADAINQQKISSTIINVVSKDRIEELPDNNAAETIGRLPGVSIQRDGGEGSKVIMRGLSPKYSLITVDGQKIPSTDAVDRSVDLSMISSDMLAGITIAKTNTPDMDADAIGGTVNFDIKKAESNWHSNIKAQGGYNKLNTSYDNFRGSGTVSNRFLENKLGVFFEGNFQRADRGSDEFSGRYLLEGGGIKTKDISLVDRLEKRDRIGANLIFDYDIDNGLLKLSSLYSRTNRDEILRRKRYRVEASLVEHTIRNREVNIDLFINSLSGKHDFDFFNLSWQGSYAITNQNMPFSHDSRFEETGAFFRNVQDKGPEGVVEDARNNVSETFFRYDYLNKQKIDDRDFAGQFDITVPYSLTDLISSKFKLGAKYKDKSRDVDNTGFKTPSNAPKWLTQDFPGRFILTPSQGNMGMSNFLDDQFRIKDFLNGKYKFEPALSVDKLQSFLDEFRYYKRTTDGTRFYGDDELSEMDDYLAGESVLAGYGMAEINIGQSFVIIPGFRYERTRNWYKTRFGEVIVSDDGDIIASSAQDTVGVLSYEDILPMVHFRYNITDWADLRLAYTNTITRPDYLNLVPRRKIDADAQELFLGQPYIGHITSKNYDLSLSLYEGTLGFFNTSGFYKVVKNIDYIRKSRIKFGTAVYDLYQPENIKNDTKVYGLESEIQTNFTFLPSPLDGIVLNINFSRIFSETFIPYNINRRNPLPPFTVTSIDTVRKITMPGQSDMIANITLGYEKGSFSFRLAYVFQSNALAIIGDTPEVDGYTSEYNRWDLAFKYKFKWNLSLLLNFNNMSNSPDRSFTSTESLPTEEKYFGWTMDFGVKYEF